VPKRLVRVAGGVVTAALLVVAVLTALHFPMQVDAGPAPGPIAERTDYKDYYGDYYRIKDDPSATVEQARGVTSGDNVPAAREFVRAHGLQGKRILEIGAGIGELQDVVADYTALDIAAEVARFYHKPFVAGSATALPFRDNSFDAIWTFGTLQSVPNPEQALREMRRVLKPGGYLLLDSAWQSRSWAAQGYEVRPYGDFDLGGKLIKASIPVRDSVAFRVLYVFPIRLLRLASASLTREPTAFRYTLLSPDYMHNWTSGSEAVNSMDPYEAILWFTSRGDDVLAFQGPVNPFFVRTGAIVFRVNKRIP